MKLSNYVVRSVISSRLTTQCPKVREPFHQVRYIRHLQIIWQHSRMILENVMLCPESKYVDIFFYYKKTQENLMFKRVTQQSLPQCLCWYKCINVTFLISFKFTIDQRVVIMTLAFVKRVCLILLLLAFLVQESLYSSFSQSLCIYCSWYSKHSVRTKLACLYSIWLSATAKL